MTYRRRISAALSILRGRPARTDYGLLLVLPFLAAAGGALIASAIDSAVERRRSNELGRKTHAAGADLAAVSSGADEARADRTGRH